MTRVNHEIAMLRNPAGSPSVEDFVCREAQMPAPSPGQMLVRNLWLSLDPYMRAQMQGRHPSGTVQPGDAMLGETVARVEVPNGSGFEVGDLVLCPGGWRTYAAVPAAAARKLPDHDVKPSLFLGVLGMPGLTAYASALHVAKVRPGETAVVSAAAGAVGSLWGQIAKLSGARVVGIAGGAEKGAFLTDELGFDAAVDHRGDDFAARLAAATPDRIEVYHDNVGGRVLEAAMTRLGVGARIVLCGLMDQYNATTPLPGPPLGPLFMARAEMKPIIVYDHYHRRARFERDVAGWVRDGRVRYREQVAEGLAAAPALFTDLMAGRNFGKCIVSLAD